MPVKSATSVTRLALYGGARKNYGSSAGKIGGGVTTTLHQTTNYQGMKRMNGGMRSGQLQQERAIEVHSVM